MSVSDFNDNRALLKSPRTVEACHREGYEPSELYFKSKQDLKIDIGNMYIDAEILELRWKAYEQTRKNKIKNVMAQRKIVVDEHKSRPCFLFLDY